jgi:hypothetical protein
MLSEPHYRTKIVYTNVYRQDNDYNSSQPTFQLYQVELRLSRLQLKVRALHLRRILNMNSLT